MGLQTICRPAVWFSLLLSSLHREIKQKYLMFKKIIIKSNRGPHTEITSSSKSEVQGIHSKALHTFSTRRPISLGQHQAGCFTTELCLIVYSLLRGEDLHLTPAELPVHANHCGTSSLVMLLWPCLSDQVTAESPSSQISWKKNDNTEYISASCNPKAYVSKPSVLHSTALHQKLRTESVSHLWFPLDASFSHWDV